MLICAVGTALAIISSNTDAQAASTTCSVTAVAWGTPQGGNLQVTCGGTTYFAFGAAYNDCPYYNIDARKAWQSLAEAALLSGKQVLVDYTACTGGPGLNYVRLIQ